MINTKIILNIVNLFGKFIVPPPKFIVLLYMILIIITSYILNILYKKEVITQGLVKLLFVYYLNIFMNSNFF